MPELDPVQPAVVDAQAESQQLRRKV
jgi:hypothetical protein